jgi:hypothetical protein
VDNSPEGAGEKPDYLSYLLRLWRVSERGGVWRASLEDPGTGVRTSFANLEALFAFLQKCTQEGEVVTNGVAGPK